MTHKGPLLAQGRTAEVFAWGQDQVLKLYFSGWSKEETENLIKIINESL